MSQEKRKLLVVDDDTGIQRQLRWSFEGYDVEVAGDREEALVRFRAEMPAVCTVDLGLPPDPDSPNEGFLIVEEMLKLAPETKIIVVTGQDDHKYAIEAIGKGAYDFYHKPIDSAELAMIIDRAYYVYELEEENRRLQQGRSTTPLSGVVTSSNEMIKVCRFIEKVAPNDVTVLLLGESGTGKELLAKAVHELSNRSAKPFAAINCAAIPETLLESELFGHEKGAFTGAVKQTKGKIEMADGGTLFLDEIGDVPLPLQVKLLRFLQERVIERIGGRQQISVDVRIVCATNQNLEELMAVGQFREDLFYRLSEIVVDIPPLRDRAGDPEVLAHAFLAKFNAEQGRNVRGFSAASLTALAEHEWPGNVRELENRIKRSVIMSDGKRITPVDLDLAEPEFIPEVLNLAQAREEAERREIPRALSRVEGNITRAAKLLGVSRPTLYDLLRHHDIKVD
ncbi:MAG: PEP-CTERM-box response regulator transcription factor [Rhodospirillaceae bacterium]|jgi:two-component system, NtrC family, response regulator|nr:PEP-CTERM-box response regulator transcription factor [Rhodospirillaceae bacterium]MBT5455865.1 PEP-CTERM-box response regulator transcription factor [Rhodospirillaceae bacterium]